MSIEEQIREEADSFVKAYYRYYLSEWHLFKNCFEAGAAFGRKLERERILEMLRSEEAEHKPRIAESQFEIEKAWDNGQGWADWLEKRLEQE